MRRALTGWARRGSARHLSPTFAVQPIAALALARTISRSTVFTFNLRQYGVINFEPSVQAVEEFRLVSGTPAAEYGFTMGSTVTLVTRSGGEMYCGSACEFFRNDQLDADRGCPIQQVGGLPRGKLRQNHFGGAFSGPIHGKSHFLFVNTEFLRVSRALRRGARVFRRLKRAAACSGIRIRMDHGHSTCRIASRPQAENSSACFPVRTQVARRN